MGAHQDLIQGAEVRILAMVDALLHCAADALIRMAAHKSSSFISECSISMTLHRVAHSWKGLLFFVGGYIEIFAANMIQ